MEKIDSIVELLMAGKVGAIFEGTAEAGSRALGHRSIIADPRLSNGKDIVNTIKNREPFRPFAGTVLAEESNKWFDLSFIKNTSPLMLFTVPVLKEKQKIIPAITHVDGSCRVQTVSNGTFYEIIKAFGKKTGVPILLNTSFNLAGKPLVHTSGDAYETFYMSNLNFLYDVDNDILLTK